MNIVLIAPPGAGKGNLANLLKERLDYNFVSAGSALREMVSSGHHLGEEISRIQKEGENVPHEWTKQAMVNKLKTIDLNKGLIFDGYPRSMDQFNDLNAILYSFDEMIDYVIYLNVDKEISIKRALGRRTCPKCGKDYNVLTGNNVPKNEKVCDDCGIELTLRNDDNIESLSNRFETYIEETMPVIETFKNKGMLIEISANGSPEDVYNKVLNVIGDTHD